MRWQLAVFIGIAALTMAGCLVPNRWLPPLPNDKFLHFGAYGVLSALAATIAHGWLQLGLWLAALFLASWLVECLQGAFVPGRKFCRYDLWANLAGIAFVACCIALYDVAS